MTRAFPISVALAIGTAAVSADDANRLFAVRGAGLLTCDVYVSQRQAKSDAYRVIGGWIDGYVTGRNQHAPDTYDATSFESTELIAEVVDAHCRKQPADRVFAVVDSIMAQLRERRIRKRSSPVAVRVGERSVALYEETIRRIQKALADRGHYKASVDGRFSTGTRDAVAAFQRKQGMQPTGFPDQATLWQLLRRAER